MPKRLEDMTEPELSKLLRAFADAVKSTGVRLLGEKPQFVLLLFNDPKIAQYVASIEREGAIEALRETADRLERRESVERVPFPEK
jgi:hypothetical protein